MNWLFLRGLAREQRHWGDFPARFERNVPGARVRCLDLPGAGTEHRRASPASVEAIMEDVRARWLALRDASEGPWGLLAMSLGGMVAMAWCEAHPEDFARVVLASTSSGELSRPWRRFAPGILPGALRAFAERDPVRREANILRITTGVADGLDDVARDWARHGEDRRMRRANVVRQLRAAAAFRAPHELATPALVLAGAGDRLAHPSCARLLASQLRAPLAIHPQAGHELALDAPQWVCEQVAAWVAPRAASPAVAHENLAASLPFVIEPAPGADRGLPALLASIERDRESLERRLLASGALLFRGFAVDGAPDFEKVARAIGPALGNQYLGTSPRNALTEYTFSASELPPHYPIPQHIEMSFVRRPPERIFFACLLPSAGPGGETPLADFRRVLRDLDPEVRARFEAKGIRTIRNYAGPEGGSRFDLWKLKRWDEMFQTTCRTEVERLCRENGFEATWRERGMLRLVGTQPAIKAHPVTGEPVWFNHAQVFHLSAVPAEYRRIAERQGQLRHRALAGVADAMVRWKRARVAPLDQAMHCTFGDGSPISDADMDAVREAIWKNMVFVRWRKGDVVVIDNRSVSHGRMPFAGPRSVAVAWA